MENFINKAIEICTEAGSKLILALLAWTIGKMIINRLMKMNKQESNLNQVQV